MRPLMNPAEAAFAVWADEQGLEVSKRGWPDFICYRDGQVFAVEVKPNKWHSLKKSQLRVMAALRKAGIPTFRWSPDIGMTPIETYAHRLNVQSFDEIIRDAVPEQRWWRLDRRRGGHTPAG